MIKPLSILMALGMATVATAQVQISLGVRETGAAGGTFTNIGGDGGTSGGIEWVNRDGQTLTLDGTWQQFTFDLANDPITAFAGATANGIIEGGFGIIEHVRILNSGGVTEPIALWIDDIADTITVGGTPQTTTFGTFEGYATGDEVIFQEPGFSGSTAGNLQAGSSGGVDNLVASRTSSDKFSFQFVDGTTTRWVRLTTYRAANQPNSLIRFDQGSIVSFWMRGGVCQPDLGSQGPGAAIAEMCGTGLNTGQQSTYYVAGAQANAVGAFSVSFAGQTDVPFLGGNMVSFQGFVFSIPMVADANGRVSFPVSGSSNVFDLALQSVFVDTSATYGIGFTNAIQAEFGR